MGLHQKTKQRKDPVVYPTIKIQFHPFSFIHNTKKAKPTKYFDRPHNLA